MQITEREVKLDKLKAMIARAKRLAQRENTPKLVLVQDRKVA